MLPRAATSPSVKKELKGAVRGLDGFNETLAWGIYGPLGELGRAPEAPKKV